MRWHSTPTKTGNVDATNWELNAREPRRVANYRISGTGLPNYMRALLFGYAIRIVTGPEGAHRFAPSAGLAYVDTPDLLSIRGANKDFAAF